MNHKPILLVEDNSSDVLLIKRALGKGHVANKLLVAEDGKEAWTTSSVVKNTTCLRPVNCLHWSY